MDYGTGVGNRSMWPSYIAGWCEMVASRQVDCEVRGGVCGWVRLRELLYDVIQLRLLVGFAFGTLIRYDFSSLVKMDTVSFKVLQIV